MQQVSQRMGQGDGTEAQGLAKVSFSVMLPTAQMPVDNPEQPLVSEAAQVTPEDPLPAKGGKHCVVLLHVLLHHPS